MLIFNMLIKVAQKVLESSALSCQPEFFPEPVAGEVDAFGRLAGYFRDFLRGKVLVEEDADSAFVDRQRRILFFQFPVKIIVEFVHKVAHILHVVLVVGFGQFRTDSHYIFTCFPVLNPLAYFQKVVYGFVYDVVHPQIVHFPFLGKPLLAFDSHFPVFDFICFLFHYQYYGKYEDDCTRNGYYDCGLPSVLFLFQKHVF